MEKQAVDSAEVLSQLREEHHEADMRLRELDRHLSLSPEEQIEIARLKKHKLHLKDRIHHLSDSPT